MEQMKEDGTLELPVVDYEVEHGSLEHLETVVDLHMRHFTGSEHLGVLLGTGFVRDTYRWFLTSPTAFVLLAKEGPRVIGFTSASDEPYDRALMKACRKSLLDGLLRRPWLMVHTEFLGRIVQSLRFASRKQLAPGTAQIAFTVVELDCRGRGVGARLKQESIRLCMDRGATGVITGIRRENSASRRMNESAGFEVVPRMSTGRMLYYRLTGQANSGVTKRRA